MADESQVLACIQQVLPIEDAHAAVQTALEEDPNNAAKFSDAPVANGISPASNAFSGDAAFDEQRLALFVGKMWKPGRTLRVLFRGGSEKVRSKVRQYAVIWSQYANIRFDFVSALPAEIRIGFKAGDGSWSYLGTDSLRRRDDEDTMNFGWFTDQTKDEEFSRTTLHEFGHALGCVHEHSQPNAAIAWNKDEVYRHHNRVSGWSKEQVDSQIFSRYSSNDVSATAHDLASIMHYPIDRNWTTNGVSVGLNSRLSATDVAFIRRMYPLPRTVTSSGTVNTLAVRSWEQPAQDNELTIPFDVPSSSPSNVLVGLNWLDVGNNANLRIRADIEDVTNDHLRLNLRSWDDTVQYSAGCAWLRLPSDDPDVQFGQFRTDDDPERPTPLLKTTEKVTFARRYDVPPTVVVWLNALDVSKDTNCRVNAYATNVKRDGFALHIDTWSDTILNLGGATWLAYSSSRTDISSGSFSTADVRPSDKPQLENSGEVSFDDAGFEGIPRVFMALNSLDTDRKTNTRVRVSSNNIAATGMTWHIDSWADTTLYSAGASYIAMAN